MTTTVKYAYDPFGRRIAKRDAFGITRFVWDGNRLLSEARGKWERTYVYEPDSFVPLARLDSVAEDGDNGRHSEVHHIHTDHLGTPNEITDQQGEIVWASEYKAWGNVLRVVQAAPKRHSVVAVEVEAANDVAQFQPIRFLGQYHDTETGLNYNRFRYYDADCGRYISLDPIGLAGGSNSYQYAPNPSGWADPLGLIKDCHCGGTKPGGWPGSGGSGPAPGTIGVTDNTSVSALLTYIPSTKTRAIEFVFDPIEKVFVTGRPHRGLFDGSGHEQLARSIKANEKTVLGGSFQRGPKMEILTSENSGHYGHRWNAENRMQFQEWLSSRVDVPVKHMNWD